MKFGEKDCIHLEQNREKHSSVEYKILKELRKFSVVPEHSTCSDRDSEIQPKNAACCAKFSPLKRKNYGFVLL